MFLNPALANRAKNIKRFWSVWSRAVIVKSTGNKYNNTPAKHRIFSAKNVTHQNGFETRTSCLPDRRTTNCAMVTRISKLLFTKWSNKVEIWQNSETPIKCGRKIKQKRNTDYDFSPPIKCGRIITSLKTVSAQDLTSR